MSSLGSDPSNPYAAPEASLSDSVPVASAAGGTLAEALAGDTGWTIGEILRDSWQRVSGFKGTFWLATLPVIAVSLVSGFATAFIAQATQSVLASNLASLLLNLVVWPLNVGMWMLGVRRAAGAETRASMIGEFYPQIGRIAGLFILQSILILLGMLFLVLPGIYLAVSYILAIPLLIDRRMGIWEALETSRRVITPCWFRTFGLLLVIGIANLVGFITLGIGLIWAVPFGVITIGMLYHRLAGYVGGENG